MTKYIEKIFKIFSLLVLPIVTPFVSLVKPVSIFSIGSGTVLETGEIGRRSGLAQMFDARRDMNIPNERRLSGPQVRTYGGLATS